MFEIIIIIASFVLSLKANKGSNDPTSYPQLYEKLGESIPNWDSIKNQIHCSDIDFLYNNLIKAEQLILADDSNNIYFCKDIYSSSISCIVSHMLTGLSTEEINIVYILGRQFTVLTDNSKIYVIDIEIAKVMRVAHTITTQINNPFLVRKIPYYTLIAVIGQKSKVELLQQCTYKCKTCHIYDEDKCNLCNDAQPDPSLESDGKTRNIPRNTYNSCKCDNDEYLELETQACVHNEYISPPGLTECNLSCCGTDFCGNSLSSCQLNSAHYYLQTQNKFSIQTGRCDVDLTKCPSGQYKDQANTCQPCKYNCKECQLVNGNQRCTICHPDSNSSHRSPNTYYNCACYQGYYDDNQLLCLACKDKCKHCSGNGPNDCITCHANRVKPDCTCPDGYIEPKSGNGCDKCNKKCETCSKQVENCVICKSPRVNAPTCECPRGYFENDKNNCQKCDTTKCVTCSEKPDKCIEFVCDSLCQTCNKSPTDCTSCKPESYNNLVVRIPPNCDCPIGYYENLQKQCMKCPYQCSLCSKKDVCEQCKLETLIEAKRNLPDCQCPQGYIENQETKNCEKVIVKPIISKEKKAQIAQEEESKQPAAQATKDATQGVSTVVVSAILPIAIFGKMGLLVNIQDLTQILYQFITIKLQQKGQVIALLSALQNFSLPFFPNIMKFIQSIEQQSEDFGKFVPDKFKKNEYTSFFLENIGATLGMFLLTIIGYRAVKIIHGFIKQTKYRSIDIFIQKQIIAFRWSGIIELVWTEYLDITMSFFLQFFRLKIESVLDIINITIWAIIGFIFMLYPAYAFYSVVKFTKTRNERYRQQFENLWNGNKHEKLSQLSYNFMLILRKILFCFAIVILHHYPTIQLSFMTSLNIILILYMLVFQPFKKLSQLVVNILTECGLAIFQLTTLFSCDEFICSNSGWDLVILVLLILVIHLTILSYNLITSFLYTRKIEKIDHHMKFDRRKVKFQFDIMKQLDEFQTYMKKKHKVNHVNESYFSEMSITSQNIDYLTDRISFNSLSKDNYNKKSSEEGEDDEEFQQVISTDKLVSTKVIIEPGKVNSRPRTNKKIGTQFSLTTNTDYNSPLSSLNPSNKEEKFASEINISRNQRLRKPKSKYHTKKLYNCDQNSNNNIMVSNNSNDTNGSKENSFTFSSLDNDNHYKKKLPNGDIIILKGNVQRSKFYCHSLKSDYELSDNK